MISTNRNGLRCRDRMSGIGIDQCPAALVAVTPSLHMAPPVTADTIEAARNEPVLISAACSWCRRRRPFDFESTDREEVRRRWNEGP